MRILSSLFTFFLLFVLSSAGNEIYASSTERSDALPAVKNNITPLGPQNFSKHFHSLRVLPEKDLYTSKGFYSQYERICPSCYAGHRSNYRAALFHPKLFLQFIVLYNQNIIGVMEDHWYNAFDYFVCDLKKKRISLKKLLTQLGPSINRPYAQLLNDSWTLTDYRLSSKAIPSEPCALLEQLKHLDRETFTATALLNMLLAARKNHPETTCLKNLSVYILQKIEHQNHLRVTKAVLKEYTKQREKESAFIIAENNNFHDPYQTSSALNNVKPIHQAFAVRRHNDCPLIIIATALSSDEYRIIASQNGKMQISSGANAPTRYGDFIPENSDLLRSNLSYYKIMRSLVDWKEREIQRMTKKKAKGCPLLAIEAAFEAFQLKGILTKSADCPLFNTCLEANQQLFWSPIYNHYFSVEDAKFLMCEQNMSMDNWTCNYEQDHKHIYIEEKLEITALTIDLQQSVLPMDKSFFDSLINSRYMGRYLGERIKYGLYLVIKQIFAAGLTTEQFLTYNDKHFFIYDAAPHMLIVLVSLLDFTAPNVSIERIYNLWEQILETSRSYETSDESHFIHALLHFFKIVPINQAGMNRGTVRQAIVASNPAMDSLKLTQLIEKTVFV